MPTRSTPAERRAELKVSLSREVALTLAQEGVDQEELAAAAGVSDTIVSRWASPRCLDSVGLVDPVLLNDRHPEVAHRLMRWVGDRCGFEIVPVESSQVADVPLAVLVERLTALVTAAVQGEERPEPRLKIGETVSLPQRLTRLQLGNSDALTLVGQFPGEGQELKKGLKEHFARFAVRGDWFALAVDAFLSELVSFAISRGRELPGWWVPA